jgi:protein CpxP
MKELLKNKWAWAVLVLVVINVATIGAIWSSMCGTNKHRACHRGEAYHHGHNGHGGHRIHGDRRGAAQGPKHGQLPRKGNDFLSRELSLTEEQKTRFEALRTEHFEKIKVHFESIKQLKKELLQSLGKTDTEVDATIQKIGALEIVIQKETFDHFNKMYALCTDAQKVKLKEKLGNIVGPPGPGAHPRCDENYGGDSCEHAGNRGKSCCSPHKRF